MIMPAIDVINLLKGNVAPKIMISESISSPNSYEIIETKNIGKPENSICGRLEIRENSTLTGKGNKPF